MGNDYNLCNYSTKQETNLIQRTIETLPTVPLIQSCHKTFEQFVQDNADFFADDRLAIVHVLLNETDFEQEINRFPIEKIIKSRKIYLPNLTKDDLFTYKGECLILNYQLGELYIGEVDCGKKSGYGISINSQGNKFDGEWDKDMQNGHGTLEILYPKRVYKGEWKNGKLQGLGSAVYQDGAKYQGSFCQGKKHGMGLMTFLDGAMYQGSFFQDLMHGFGTLTSSKGRQISGEWKQGKYQVIRPQRSSRTFSINQLPVL